MKPLCSICVPTYNRAEYLEKLLKSIAAQKVFLETSKIEVVISDNASSDETQNIVQRYISAHGNKIRYYRNEKSLPAMNNFYNVFSQAQGIFLKLCNDTCEFVDNSLLAMAEFIETHQTEKPVLFFLNSGVKNQTCNTLNEFVGRVSYYSTWSVSFGIWDTDRDFLNYFISKSDSQIAQTFVLCKMISEGRQAVVNDDIIFKVHNTKNKGGYNIAEVFGKNYLTILKEFVDGGALSLEVFNKEKELMLKKHINYFYFDHGANYAFSKTGYFKYLLPFYKWNLYFYVAALKEYRKSLSLKLRGYLGKKK